MKSEFENEGVQARDFFQREVWLSRGLFGSSAPGGDVAERAIVTSPGICALGRSVSRKGSIAIYLSLSYEVGKGFLNFYPRSEDPNSLSPFRAAAAEAF